MGDVVECVFTICHAVMLVLSIFVRSLFPDVSGVSTSAEVDDVVDA